LIDRIGVHISDIEVRAVATREAGLLGVVAPAVRLPTLAHSWDVTTSTPTPADKACTGHADTTLPCVFWDPMDPQLASDPWDYYAALRRTVPIHRSPLGFWVLTRHADCLALLRDRGASSDGMNIDPTKVPQGFRTRDRVELEQFIAAGGSDPRPFLFRDPPDHTRLRGLVSKAFTPRMVEGLRPRVEAIVKELLDRAFDRGEMDAVADFAYPLPVRIICDMMGVPAEDEARFRDWSAILARGLDPDFLLTDDVRDARTEALASFSSYFFDLLAQRRRRPGDDLLSELAAAEEEGDRLSEGEMLSTAILLLVAGHETTVNLISGGLLALLNDPAQLDRMRGDPGLDRSGVEELLRFVSPVQLTGRSMLGDLRIGDDVIGRGEFVIALVASANRDPDAFGEPDRLDLGRADNRHLGFGFGIHHCLGAPLARLEAQVAIPTLLRRARVLELQTDAPVWRANVVLRGLSELPVRAVAA